jgi:hypothetical protein
MGGRSPHPHSKLPTPYSLIPSQVTSSHRQFRMKLAMLLFVLNGVSAKHMHCRKKSHRLIATLSRDRCASATPRRRERPMTHHCHFLALFGKFSGPDFGRHATMEQVQEQGGVGGIIVANSKGAATSPGSLSASCLEFRQVTCNDESSRWTIPASACSSTSAKVHCHVQANSTFHQGGLGGCRIPFTNSPAGASPATWRRGRWRWRHGAWWSWRDARRLVGWSWGT